MKPNCVGLFLIASTCFPGWLAAQPPLTVVARAGLQGTPPPGSNIGAFFQDFVGTAIDSGGRVLLGARLTSDSSGYTAGLYMYENGSMTRLFGAGQFSPVDPFGLRW